jgi:phosphate butyryltransferase
MVFRSFEEIAAAVKKQQGKRVLAVAGAEDRAVVEAALHAQHEGIAEPLLVGDRAKINEILRSLDQNPADHNVVNASAGGQAQKAVDLVKDGTANVLMKGMIETGDMMHSVVRKENNLRTGRVMSHVVFFDRIPKYHKLLVQTDGGMVMYPTLEDKKAIIENAVSTLLSIGYVCPKVAVLAAIEKVNPKMIESVEADALRQMNLSGEIENCVVEGPISYDVAMNKDIARHKGYSSDNCGDFDVLIVPNMNAGNILSKCWTVTCNALMGGVIIGAKVPVILNSRGSSAEEKFYSIALAALVTAGGQV